jgi:hypothetical protein
MKERNKLEDLDVAIAIISKYLLQAGNKSEG